MTMISKAGYFQQNGYAALDDEGMPNQIAELNIYGTKYGIRLDELREALYGRHPARVERVFQNWQQYLRWDCGTCPYLAFWKGIKY